MELFENLSYARRSAIAFIVVGIIFQGLNYLSLKYSDSYYPSLLYIGWMVIFLGVALIIVPGSEVKKDQFPEGEHELKYFWSISPTYAKTIWIIAMLGGLLFAFFQERIINNPMLEMYG